MKIFKSSECTLLMKDNHFHFLPFEFENTKWTIVDKISESDIVPVLFTYVDSIAEVVEEMKALGHTNQTVLILNLFWIGIILSIICSRYRDFNEIILNSLQIIFYATPILWSTNVIPDKFLNLYITYNLFYHLFRSNIINLETAIFLMLNIFV